MSSQVYIIFSSDGGTNWTSGPNDNLPIVTERWAPAVSASPNGHIVVAFYERYPLYPNNPGASLAEFDAGSNVVKYSPGYIFSMDGRNDKFYGDYIGVAATNYCYFAVFAQDATLFNGAATISVYCGYRAVFARFEAYPKRDFPYVYINGQTNLYGSWYVAGGTYTLEAPEFAQESYGGYTNYYSFSKWSKFLIPEPPVSLSRYPIIRMEEATYQANYTVFTGTEIRIKNEFRASDPGGGQRSFGGKIVYSTGLGDDVVINNTQDLPDQAYKVRLASNQSHKLKAVEQQYGSYYRGFNTRSDKDGGWVVPNGQGSTTTLYAPEISIPSSTPLYSGNYIAKYRNRYDVQFNAQYEFDPTGVALTPQQVWQYESSDSTLPVETPRYNSTSGAARQYDFQYWTNGTTTTSLPAVTPTDNTSYTAFYKGKLLSSVSAATNQSGQRRLAQDLSNPNYLYLVYESSGKIWLTYSTDAGSTWQPERYVADGSNPSVTAGIGRCLLVWRGKDETTANRIYGRYFRTDQAVYINPADYFTFLPAFAVTSASGIWENASPVAAILTDDGGNRAALVVYEGTYLGNTALRATYTAGDGSAPNPEITVPGSIVTGANQRLSASLDYLPNAGAGNYNARLAWQTYNGTSDDPIRFIEIGFQTPQLTFSPSAPVTVSSGYTPGSHSPRLVVNSQSLNANKHIAWVATDHNSPYSNTPLIAYQILYGASNTPSSVITVFRSSVWGSHSPTVQRESNGAVSLYFESDGIKQVRRVSDGSSTWTMTALNTGSAPQAIGRSDARRFAYLAGSGIPAQIRFGTGSAANGGGLPPADLRSASRAAGAGTVSGTEPQAESLSRVKTDGTATAFSASDESPMTVLTATEVRLTDTVQTPNPFISLMLSEVQLGGTNVGARLLPDAEPVTPNTIFELLNSYTGRATDTAQLITAKLEVRSQAFSELNRNVKVWTELCDSATNQVLATSEKIKLTASDTLQTITAAFNAAQLGITNQAVYVRVQVSGMKPRKTHRLMAMNHILIGGAQDNGAGQVQATVSNAVQMAASQTVASAAIPTAFGLSQNYPNPFNPTTVIKYGLPEAAKVSVRIYDMLGRVVSELVNETKAAGYYEARFDASRLSSGTYFYRLQAGSFVEIKKMVLVK